MCQELFNRESLEQLGTLSTDSTLPTNIGFKLGIPVDEIQKNLGAPTITYIHGCVMKHMYREINVGKNLLLSVTQHANEFERFTTLFATAHEENLNADKKCYAAQKVRIHELNKMKKKNAHYTYTPRHPNSFERDIFIMGKDSFYYHFCTKEGLFHRACLLQ